MKRISLLLMSLIFCLSVLVPAKAADPAVNRSLGYFENTRTVLLLRARYRSGEEAAAYVNREMERIFRYPYYRTLDPSAYEADLCSTSQLKELAEKANADIVVMPVITEWRQVVYHRSLFCDADDIVETRAVFDIYSYKKGEPSVRDDRATYWNSEEEGTVRNRYIFDDLMQDILKTFPYRRVPTDIARNLTGEPDRTPLAEMGK